MSNKQDQALGWVKDEVNKTLDQARQALENFAENTDDTTQIRFCSSGLHQVRGTLQMLEFFGAARMADELEKLADGIADGEVSDQNAAVELLMQGIVQMPQYLESLQRGQRDIPLVLLPMLNEIRKSRGVEPLSESAVFSPNLKKAEARPAQAAPKKIVSEDELKLAAKKLRQHFQKGLLGILKNENLRESFVRMHKVIERLEIITSSEKISTLWWVTNGFLIVIREDMLFRNPTIHALLSHVDKQIKLLAENGSAEVKKGAPKELLKNLLYFIAKSKSKDAKVIELQKTFQLAEDLPDEEKLKAQRSQMSGPDSKAIETVVAAIREDLANVKENLDVMVRSGAGSSSLQSLIAPVQQISDTLSMLGLTGPQQVIIQQIQVLKQAASEEPESYDAVVMDVAGALLFVEASLSGFLNQRRKSQTEEDTKNEAKLETAKQHQFDEAKLKLISEARGSLQKSKDSIVDFMASSFDHRIVEGVPEQIEGISSAIGIIGLDKAGELLHVTAEFIRKNLLAAQKIPREDSLEALADVFTSIDFFLEGILDNNDAGLESILKAAAESAEILKRSSDSDTEAEPASEPQAPAEKPKAAPAKSNADVDEELISEEVIEIFLEEAEEELESIQTQLPRWMSNFEDNEALTTIRRSFHTLKGSGRLVGAQIIGELAWSIENLLNRVIDKTIEPTSHVTQAIEDARDMLPELVEAFSKQVEPQCDSEKLRLRAEAIAKGEEPKSDQAAVEEAATPDAEPTDTTGGEAMVEDADVVGGHVQGETLEQSGDEPKAGSGQPDQAEESTEIDPVLMEIFLSEAGGHITDINQFIDSAMNSPMLPKPTDSLVRALHTLKGSAHMAGFHLISQVVGPLENHVRECKNRESKLSEEALLVIADCSKYITQSLEDLKQSRFIDEKQSDELLQRANDLSQELTQSNKGTVDEGERDLELFTIFLNEGNEILTDTDSILNEWIIEPALDHREKLLSEMHTLKRGANMASVFAVEDLSGAIESYLERLDSSDNWNEAFFDLLKHAVSGLHDMLDSAAADQEVKSDTDLIGELESFVVEPDAVAISPELEQSEELTLEAEPEDEASNTRTEDLQRELDELSNDLNASVEATSGPEAESAESEELIEPDESLLESELEAVEESAGESVQVETDSEVYPFDDMMEIFIEEADELLENIHDVTGQWQERIYEMSFVAELQRNMHTLKGSARMAGANHIGTLGHELEDIYEALVNGKIKPTNNLVEIAEEVHDTLGDMVEAVRNGQPVANPQVLLDRIKEIAEGGAEADVAVEPEEKPVNELPTPEVEAEITPAITEEAMDYAEEEPQSEELGEVELESESVSEVSSSEDEGEVYPVDDLMEIFLEEAEEILDNLGETTARWQEDPNNVASVAELQRDMHTLKGSARMAGAPSVGDLGHELEFVYEAVVDGRVKPSRQLIELAEHTHDELNEMVQAIIQGRPVKNPQSLVSAIKQLAKGSNIEDIPELRGLLPSLGHATLSSEAQTQDISELPEVMEIEEVPEPDIVEEPELLDAEEVIEPDAAEELEENLELSELTEPEAPLELDEEPPELADVEEVIEPEIVDELESNLELSELTEPEEDTFEAPDLVTPDAEDSDLESEDDGIYADEFKLKGELDLGEEYETAAPGSADSVSEVSYDTPEIVDTDEVMEPHAVEELEEHLELSELTEPEKVEEEEIEPESEVEFEPESELELEADTEAYQERESESAFEDIPAAEAPSGEEVMAVEIDEDDEDILEIYLEEAGEILEEMDATLIEWMGKPNNREPIDLILRHLHTLKGGARLSNLTAIGDLSHEIEAYFEGIDSQTKVTNSATNTIQDGYDILASLVKQISADKEMTYPTNYLARLKHVKEFGEEPEEAMTDSIAAPEVETQESESVAEIEHDPVEEAVDTEEDMLEEPEASSVELEQPAPEEAQTNANVESLPQKKPSEEKKEEAPQREGHMAEVVPMKLKSKGQQAAPNQQESAGATQQNPQEVVKVGSETLENLVNLAGETSIFRSRLEQQVIGLRGNLEEMGSTVERLRMQLRNLEIETEAQVVYRREVAGYREYEDFDPLEMDRYTRQQELTRSLGESAADLLNLKDSLDSLASDSETLLLQQGRVNTELQERLMRTRMVPFTSVVPRLRRIVRQIGRELGKPVELSISAEGEMDRTILERMVAPIEHMLRNAIDHGIESPEKRKQLGKSETGKIKIKLFREGGEVVIRVQDDGAGINHEAIRKKALERGLITPESNLSEHELQLLILEAGFSTAEQVTQISGRGVGMDVVNSEIKQMGGVIDIDSTFGEGTLFTVSLPFTVSVNQALMVMIGEDIYAIPLSSIEGIVRVSPIELQELYSEANPEYTYAGIDYNLKYLGSLIEPGRAINFEGAIKPLPLLLLHGADKPIAVHVDDLMGSREIVVKAVGQQLSSVTGLSGASILGDGRVVLILDILAFLRMAESQVAEVEQIEEVVTERETPLVMVVDDSITVRKVTARLLERHEYDVITAKDGVDALTVLQEHRPDVMLLDIEMPRMDGFELATIIRHDEKLKKLPIIMITSRTGEKHRTRAESIGVNHYMGKPFNETLLLDTIQQLVHN